MTTFSNNLLTSDDDKENSLKIDSPILEDDKNNISSYPIMSSVFLGKPPPLLPTKYDVKKRDSLFNELQQLKKISSPSIEEKNKIISLEQEITNMMNLE